MPHRKQVAFTSVTVHTWGEKISGRVRRRCTQRPQAFLEGIQAPRQPRLKQACQSHADPGPRCAPAAPADCADDHQRPDTAFRLVVVGAQPIHQHKREEFVLVA